MKIRSFLHEKGGEMFAGQESVCSGGICGLSIIGSRWRLEQHLGAPTLAWRDIDGLVRVQRAVLRSSHGALIACHVLYLGVFVWFCHFVPSYFFPLYSLYKVGPIKSG